MTKKCSCGRDATLDKNNAKENDLGYWQDCVCKSTLFFPHTKSERADSFAEIMKKNKETKERLTRERKEANEKVKKSYRLGGK